MRIEQSSSFITNFLSDIRHGQILPAAFQRPYVWSREDVEALCDSILSGFPIGSFLLWAPGHKADLATVSRGRIGPIPAGPIDAKHPLSHSLLLDGQNRMATLAWMMRRDDEPPPHADWSDNEKLTWINGNEKLVLDYATKSIRFVPGSTAAAGLRLPAWMVLPSPERMPMLRKHWDRWEAEGIPALEIDAFVRWFDDCCHAFREARVTTTVLVDATVEEARHAFLRICRVGVAMSQVDFDHAIGWEPSVTEQIDFK